MNVAVLYVWVCLKLAPEATWYESLTKVLLLFRVLLMNDGITPRKMDDGKWGIFNDFTLLGRNKVIFPYSLRATYNQQCLEYRWSKKCWKLNEQSDANNSIILRNCSSYRFRPRDYLSNRGLPISWKHFSKNNYLNWLIYWLWILSAEVPYNKNVGRPSRRIYTQKMI